MKVQASHWGLWLAGLIILQCILACGKRCRDKDTEIVPYPEELHAYIKPYRLGSWWVYENTNGLQDSVYLTEYKETLHNVDRQGRSCIGLPLTTFALRTEHMDTTGMVYIRYTRAQHNAMAFVSLAAIRYHGWIMMEFGFDLQGAFGDAHVVDTTISSNAYASALRVDRDASLVARNLNSIVLARNIGIVAYVNDTDTFTLTEYHVP